MVKLKHHSTGDWDYSGTNWRLDNGQYVSAPSSFQTSHGISIRALIKTTTVPIANVKEGRFDTYLRRTAEGGTYPPDFRIIFRYQDDSNFYYIEVNYPLTAVVFHRVKAGVNTTLKTTAISWAFDTWLHIRVTWWNDYVGLVIRLEKYNGTWAIIDDAYDSENNWKDIGGRVGFLYVSIGDIAHNGWVDDTTIYGIS